MWAIYKVSPRDLEDKSPNAAQSPNAVIYKINKTAHQPTSEELLSTMFGEAPIHHHHVTPWGDGGRPLPISTDPLVSGVPFSPSSPLISFCLSPSFSIVGPGRGFMLNQLRLIISIAYGEQVLTAVAHKPEFRGGNPVFEVMSRVSQSGVAKTPWSTPRYRPRGFHFSARTHLFINSIMARQWLFSVRSWWTRQTGFYPHLSSL